MALIRKAQIALVVALVATLAALYVIANPSHQPAVRIITLGSLSIPVEVADTEALRQRGLSGRESLPPGQGMLFVFPEDGYWAIWMKDMRFSIDILWLDASGRVLRVAHSVAPETYPMTFGPYEPARYVLELRSGFAQSHGIAEGAQFVL